MPISFRQAFAAGAAAEAARQAGKPDDQQLQQAQLTAHLVDQAAAEESGPKAAAEEPKPPGVVLHQPHGGTLPVRLERVPLDAPRSHKPTQPPGPGLLGHIARWLNLK